MIRMNNELVLNMIYVSIIASFISSQAIQKIKEVFNKSSMFNKIISLFLSFTIGVVYSLSFYNSNIIYALWVGLFTLIGAQGLYKTFKGYFGLESIQNKENKKE